MRIYNIVGNINFTVYELHGGKYTKYFIEREFDNFENVINYINDNIDIKIKEIKKEDIDRDIKRVYNAYGKITSGLYKKFGIYDIKNIYDFYDSFDKMKKELNICNKGNTSNFSKSEIMCFAKNEYNINNGFQKREFLKKYNITERNFKKYYDKFSLLLKDIKVYDIRKDTVYKKRNSNNIRNKKNYSYNKEDIFNICSELYVKNNNSINLQVINKNSDIPYSLINKYYGNINSLKKTLFDNNKNFSNEDIKEYVNELYRNNGKITVDILKSKSNIYTYKQIIDAYGSYENIKNEFNIVLKNNNIKKQDVLDDIMDIYKKYGHVSKYYLEQYGKYNYSVYYTKFGNAPDIYKAIGIISPDINCTRSEKSNFVLNMIEKILNCECEYEKQFDDCINSKTGKKLRFDGYFEKYNLLVEYDGEQHFHYIKAWYKTIEDFNNVLYKDKLKNDYAKNNNIKLLRIRYDDDISYENIKNTVNNIVSKNP